MNIKHTIFLLTIFTFIHSYLIPNNGVRISGGAKGSFRFIGYNSPEAGFVNIHLGHSLFINYNNYKLTYLFISAPRNFLVVTAVDKFISYQLLFGKSIVSKSHPDKLFNIPIEDRVVGSIGLSQNIIYYYWNFKNKPKKRSYYSIPFQIECEKTFWSRFGISMTIFACVGKDNKIGGLSFDIFFKNI